MRSGICLGPGAWASWTDREDGCRRVGKLVQVFARCLLHVVFLITLVLCGGHRGTEHLPHHGFTQLASILTVKSDLAILTWECFRIESVVVL